MEAKTYEIIIETLTEALEMERWRKEKAEKKALELEQENALARKIIDDLQKEVHNGEF